jgi:hypothetical protein
VDSTLGSRGLDEERARKPVNPHARRCAWRR